MSERIPDAPVTDRAAIRQDFEAALRATADRFPVESDAWEVLIAYALRRFDEIAEATA